MNFGKSVVVCILSGVFFLAHLVAWNDFTRQLFDDFHLSIQVKILLVVATFVCALLFGSLGMFFRPTGMFFSSFQIIDFVLLLSIAQAIGAFVFYFWNGSIDIAFLGGLNFTIAIALVLCKKTFKTGKTKVPGNDTAKPEVKPSE